MVLFNIPQFESPLQPKANVGMDHLVQHLQVASLSEAISRLSCSEDAQDEDIASRCVVASIRRNTVKDCMTRYEPLADSRMIADSVTARKSGQFP
jgi:hypothetical protein